MAGSRGTRRVAPQKRTQTQTATRRAKIVAVVIVLLFFGTSALAIVSTLNDTPPSAATLLDLTTRPLRGDATAPIAVILFESPACSACAAFHTDGSLTRFVSEYVVPGRARLFHKAVVVGEYPWERAAQVSQECVTQQWRNGFWSFTDSLYQDLAAVTDGAIEGRRFAETRGLDLAQYDACVRSTVPTAALERDFEDADRLSVSGRPAAFVLDATDSLLRVDTFDYVGLKAVMDSL